MMFGYGGSGWPIWAMALMWIGMLVVLGVLIWGGYALMTSTARRPGPGQPGEPVVPDQPRETDARRILDDRLARGQIDAAEYQSLRDLIAAGDDHAPAGAGTQ
jgi:putative membrane protein